MSVNFWRPPPNSRRRARGEYFPKAWFDRLSLDDAYGLQLALLQRSGGRRVGWKVGLTARAIQQQFGVHEPVFGCLLADGRLDSGHVFRRDELIEPGFENELCIVMGRDLAPDATREDVAAAIARVHPAFEIIETRGDLTRQLAWRSPTMPSKRRLCSAPRSGATRCPSSTR
jgi:2-keto-4-pentenoate hydratase